MAKILIELNDAADATAAVVKMDGPTKHLAAMLVRAAATLLVQAREPDKSLYSAGLAFGLAVYKDAAELIEKGQTHNGVYIEEEGAE